MAAPSIHRHVGPGAPPIDALIAEADREGHAFVRRTADEWTSGANRFDGAGEVFFVATAEGETVGMCGLNVDGYLSDPTVGRLRHLYVTPEHRGSGLGEQLVQHCLDHAVGRFELVRLRTPGAQADRFYDRLGFERSDSPTATHVWTVGR